MFVFRSARSVRLLSATAYSLMAAVAAAAVGVGLKPYDLDGHGAVCASPLARLTGAVTPLQSVAERFHGGACIPVEGQATALMSALLSGAVMLLAVALMTGSWARQLQEAR